MSSLSICSIWVCTITGANAAIVGASNSARSGTSTWKCSRNWKIRRVANRPHRRASDTAGNVDASPATHSWTISAPAPTCTVSTQTLGANADAWILQSSAGQNYGTDSVLKVDTKSASNARALVRFNLPAIPAGCTVTSAKLRLHASSYKAGRQLRAFRLNAAWTEGGVRWNNQP